jgi:hypothetical protein
MRKKQLKIETHISPKSEELNKLKANKSPNLKNIKFFKHLYKAKLEDRYRIKGISFSTHKKNVNNFILYKQKKNEEATEFELNEATFYRTLRDYNQLKHEIYLKEQKEKKVITKEAILNEKIIKKDINYTFLKETIYQFMRFKKSHNKYNSNLLKNKDAIKRANKIAKSNFINKTMKSVTQKFHSIGGKIDMGVSKNEEILGEKEYEELMERISKSRLKHLKSFQATNTNPGFETPLLNIKSKKSQYIPNLNTQLLSFFKDNYQEMKKEPENKNNFKLFLKTDFKNKEEKQEEMKYNNNDINNICKTDLNIQKDSLKLKRRKSESLEVIARDNNSIANKNENKRAKSSKYKTHILKNPIQIKNSMKNNSVKANIFDIKEIEKDNSITNSSDGNQSKIDNETKKSNESSLLLNDLINIERLKKNNIIKEKKNPTYWNNNMKRARTAENRKVKVINKPIYVSKISDFVKEYNRIKSVSNKVKKRMREKHLTTLENIDKISKTKEDLLMFLLKMKFFHCSFPIKKEKKISKKELFLKKFKNYLNIIDNPYSLATRELKAELKKYKNL